ncbi:uncharacterized protein ACMZJ9_016436 [Mantella aurantiaca]
MSETTTEPTTRKQRRRRRRKGQGQPEDLNGQFLSQVTELITTKEDELDMLGQTVACKLRKMREDQRLVAEYLINYTLYLGLMNRLENDEKTRPNYSFAEYPASELGHANEAHNSDSSFGGFKDET